MGTTKQTCQQRAIIAICRSADYDKVVRFEHFGCFAGVLLLSLFITSGGHKERRLGVYGNTWRFRARTRQTCSKGRGLDGCRLREVVSKFR
jgi:hypothetical protein